MNFYTTILSILIITIVENVKSETCSYPDIHDVCRSIANSEESHWEKVSRWKKIISALDLSSIQCKKNEDNINLTNMISIESDVFEKQYQKFHEGEEKKKGKLNLINLIKF